MNFSLNRGRRRTATPQPTSASVSFVETSPTPPDDTSEPIDISSTEYARMCREMMQLINDLRSLGQVENRGALLVAELFP